MLTLVQLASLFGVFSVATVLCLSLVALRLKMRTEAFFRSWVASYAWSLAGSSGAAAMTFVGPTGPVFGLLVVSATMVSWWWLRMSFELRGRPFPVAVATTAFAAVFAACIGMFLAGLPFAVAAIPGSLVMVGTHLWLGLIMIRMGRDPANAGLAWFGLAVMVHGLWFLTYPLFEGTSWHWLGHSVEACLEIGVGGGLTLHILQRGIHQLDARNRDLAIAEQELRAAQAARDESQRLQIAQLEETDRLKQEFMNAASHELRTPLTSIVGYAEFLEDGIGGPLTPDQAGYVAQIRKGTVRLRRIVDDMLDIARVEAGTFHLDPGPADVGEIVRDEVESLVPFAAERGVALRIAAGTGPLLADIDAHRVGQVMLNLVTNALKFTAGGGAVDVTAAIDGDVIRVSVRDTGIGIEAAHLPRLFDKFYQVSTGTTRTPGGTGLGLAISRALVEAHGGRIGAESAPGRGSTFWFTLPRAGAPAVADPPSTQSSNQTSSS